MDYIDYYKTLELEPNAPPPAIEAAYTTLTQEHWADEARCQQLHEAYLVLSDEEKRSRYLALREKWQDHTAKNSANSFDWTPWISSHDDAPAIAKEHSALYQAVFAVPAPLPEESPTTESELTEADAPSTEDENTPPITKSDTEDSANKPSPEGTTAKTAEKKAKKREFVQKIQISIEESFHGTTRVLKIGDQQMQVNIPRGSKNGTRIRVRGKDGQIRLPDSSGKEQTGDLFLEIELQPHEIFEADGEDLLMEMSIDLYSAVLGGEALVPNLGKGKIKLKIPAGTQTGRVFRLKNLGLPRLQQPDERGYLQIKTLVTIPEDLTPEEIALFEELADLRGL